MSLKQMVINKAYILTDLSRKWARQAGQSLASLVAEVSADCYNLCSRSGTEAELKDMITRCNNVGVTQN